jgi:hypothetical protein
VVLLGGNKIYVLVVINKLKKFKKRKERKAEKKENHSTISTFKCSVFDVLLCSFLVVSNFG